MSAQNVSVLLLARDETADLEELLPTLAFAAEVVVVWDPRGERATREVAERLGARVFEHVFEGFGLQRQFALERCTREWVLWIDADERLDAAAGAALADGTLLASAAARGAWSVSLRRVSRFLGRRIRFCGWQGEHVVRIFRRRASRFDDAPVHERVLWTPAPGEPPRPDVIALDVGLEHHSYRTLADCEVKLERYASANAEKAYRAGRRAGALDVALRPPLRFLRQYVLQLGVLDGVAGLLLCRYAARQVRRKYELLRERSRAGGRA